MSMKKKKKKQSLSRTVREKGLSFFAYDLIII